MLIIATTAAAVVPAGNGGFVGATGTEINTGEIWDLNLIPKIFPQVRLVFFCPVNVTGEAYAGNICPGEVDAGFTTRPETGINAIKASVNDLNWDIAEVI